MTDLEKITAQRDELKEIVELYVDYIRDGIIVYQGKNKWGALYRRAERILNQIGEGK